MKSLLEFDDAGASDSEPVKGVTVGDIRAWHDDQELHSAHYDRMLTSWAECRDLLSKERAITAALIKSMREIEVYSTDMVAINGSRAAINATLLAIPAAANDGRVRLVDQNGTEITGPACACYKQIPTKDCPHHYCAFRSHLTGGVDQR